jgi:hypothetical protein
MARSQSDSEVENEGRASNSGDRASLTAFLAPATRSGTSEPPRNSAPPSSKAAGADGQPRESKSFWDVPSARRSGSIIPGEPTSDRTQQSNLAAIPPKAAPVAAAPTLARPSAPDWVIPPPSKAAPVSVEPDADAETAVSKPAAPGAPSTLAPSAYDARAEDDGPIEEEAPIENQAAPASNRAALRAAIGALIAIVAVGVVVRARHSGPPAAAVSDATPGSETAALKAGALDLPDITDEPAGNELGTVDDATARELQRRARELLISGQIVEGVAYARRAIAARPLDSENYVLLAAGLEDLGHWQEARNIFSQCVKRSGGPSSAECRYFATQGN